MFGVCSFAYRWSIGRPYYRPENPLGLIDFIGKMADYGVKAVQICNNVDLHEYDQKQLEEVKTALQERGLVVETGSRGTTVEHFKKHIDVASFLGARVLRVVYDIDRDKGPEDVARQLDAAVACFKEVMPHARKHGVAVALENGYTISIYEVRDVIQRVDDDLFGACLDTLNSVSMVEKAEAVFDVLLPYAKQVHFKDFVIEFDKRGNIIKGVALGDGWNDFQSLKKRLDDAGYKGNIFLELYIDRLDDEKETMAYEDACVRKSLDYARSIGLLN